jgi:hypothetical protein
MNLKITNVGAGTVMLRQHLTAGGVDEHALGPTAYLERTDTPTGPNVNLANVEVIPYDEASYEVEIENTDMPADEYLAVSEVNGAGLVTARSINENKTRVRGVVAGNAYWSNGFRIETSAAPFGQSEMTLDAMEFGDLSGLTRAQIQRAQVRVTNLARRLEQAEDDAQNTPPSLAGAPSWPQPPLPPQAQQPTSSTAVAPMTTGNTPGLVQGDPAHVAIPLPSQP